MFTQRGAAECGIGSNRRKMGLTGLRAEWNLLGQVVDGTRFEEAGKPLSGVTSLLLQWNSGDVSAREALLERVHAELTAIAGRRLAGERHALTFEPAALVNEAYLKLIDLDRIDWQNRAHFFAMAARLMRQVLIDHARKRDAAKRDGGVRVTWTGVDPSSDPPQTDVLLLNGALDKLAEADPDRARLVELRFFGGLTIEETAEVLGSSPATVKRHWDVARGWLHRAMKA